jgi:hypothetical protein
MKIGKQNKTDKQKHQPNKKNRAKEINRES